MISAWEITAAGWQHKRLIRLTGFVGPVSIAPPGNITLFADTEAGENPSQQVVGGKLAGNLA